MLAPLALGVFAVIFLIVVVSSLDNGPSSVQSEPARGAAAKSRPSGQRGSAPAVTEKRVYVVKPGDTLSKIAGKTGIAIDRLLMLNPSVDPEGLVSGQRIKLRE